MGLGLFDFECQCGNVFEELIERSESSSTCPICNKHAKRIISSRGVYSSNEDAPWIRTVLEVVDKQSSKPHTRAFLSNPTRTNYRNWMKENNLKPVDYTEHGGPPTWKKPELPKPNIEYLHRRAMERRGGSISTS